MAAKKVNKTFNVQARVWADVGVDIVAVTLEEAVESSKKLKLEDFITIDGDHNDSGLRVTGLFESEVDPKI